MASSSQPANLTFVMGETERKMDMALDDIIKMSHKSAKQQRRRLLYKKGQTKSKANAQANIAARSLSLRQKKMKQARSLSGYGYINSQYVASKKALFAAPVTAASRRNQTRSRRGNRRPARFNPVSLRNIIISVWNSASQIRKEHSLGGWRRNLNFSSNPHPRLPQPSGTVYQVDDNNPTGRFGTLDSLFASMRRQRTVSHRRNRGRRYSNIGGMY